MKTRWTRAIPFLLTLALILAGCAQGSAAAPTAKPWPTHAPEATPYVRVYDGTAAYEGEAEPVEFESIEDMWGHFKTQFGRFYARGEEL